MSAEERLRESGPPYQLVTMKTGHTDLVHFFFKAQWEGGARLAAILLCCLLFPPNIIYLLAVLGLHPHVRAFSSCGKRGLLSPCGAGVSLQWLLLLRGMGSTHMGLAAPQHVGS